MDLVADVSRVIVLMEHVAKEKTAALTIKSCPDRPAADRWAWWIASSPTWA